MASEPAPGAKAPNRTLAVIAARGGSRGIPGKNLFNLCGKPLIAWSIEQARAARGVDLVAVSSDSEKILGVAERFGAVPVERPVALAGDRSPSEAAWRHALDALEARTGAFRRVLALQATSPVREAADLAAALEQFDREALDSLLSVCEVRDYFNWKIGADGRPQAVNYDYHERRMRQDIERRFLENGSFYVFTPSLLRDTNNRLGGRIGVFIMARHKLLQIDDPEDARLCAVIMRGYGYA